MCPPIKIMDGAVSTVLSPPGELRSAGVCESLNLKAPQTVLDLHRAYVEAGADILTTNSFSAHPVLLEEIGLGGEAERINREAARLAKEAAVESTRPLLVAGSMGPLPGKFLTPSAKEHSYIHSGYIAQAEALLEGGADYILIETIYDLSSAAPSWQAIETLRGNGVEVDLALSLTFTAGGKTPSLEALSSFIQAVAPLSPLYIGFNCSTGPSEMIAPLKKLANISPFPICAAPCAGLPDSGGRYPVGPGQFAREMEQLVLETNASFIGGCCGTTPEHVRATRKLLIPAS